MSNKEQQMPKFFKSISIFSKDEKMDQIILHNLKNKIQFIPDKKKWINGIITPEGVFLPCQYGSHEGLKNYLIRLLKLSSNRYPYKKEDFVNFEQKFISLRDSNQPPHYDPVSFGGRTMTAYQKLILHEWAVAKKWQNHWRLKQQGYIEINNHLIFDINLQIKPLKED